MEKIVELLTQDELTREEGQEKMRRAVNTRWIDMRGRAGPVEKYIKTGRVFLSKPSGIHLQHL